MSAEQKQGDIRFVPMEQMYALMLPQLAQGGSVSLTVSGCSMYPMLRHRQDSVKLQAADRFRKGELIFYRREDGAFVLHRIVRILPEDAFLCCGDNQYEPENVSRQQVIAKMTEFTRSGKTYRAEDFGYRLYVAVWVWLFPVRRPLLALRRFLGRVRSRLRRRRKD